jgi:hypothetical protein
MREHHDYLALFAHFAEVPGGAIGQDNGGEAATRKAPSNVIDRRDDSQWNYRIEAMGSAISHTWQAPETGSNVINSMRATNSGRQFMTLFLL